MSRVLVVDDDPAIRRTLVANLEARRYDVDVAADGRTALTLAAGRHPDVVLGIGDAVEGCGRLLALPGPTRRVA